MRIPSVQWPTEPGDYDGDLLLSIEPVVLSLLVRGRNAWHSTWVRHYFRDAALFSDVKSAKRGAEQWRERGNVFYVYETPALLFRGMSAGVVICDHLETVPFDGFTGMHAETRGSAEDRRVHGIFPGISLRDAIECISGGGEHWKGTWKNPSELLRGAVDRDFEFEHPSGELASFQSYAQGPDHYLGWASNTPPREYRSEAVQRIVSQWNAAVDVALAAAPSTLHRRADQFIHYRDMVLGAKPASIWKVQRDEALAIGRARRRREMEELHAARVELHRLRAGLGTAEAELESARADRMIPASSSAGVRAQRERVETAERDLVRMRGALAQAQREFRDASSRLEENALEAE